MSQDTRSILIDFIKIDMQQVEFYKNAIYRLVVYCISGSFAVSAFVFSHDGTLSHKAQQYILWGVNLGAIVITALIGFFYINNLNFSRKILEMRECALKIKLNGEPLTSNDLYPDVKGYKIKFPLRGEQLPLFIAMAAIFVKLIIEILMLHKAF